jgi:hypothetical protein
MEVLTSVNFIDSGLSFPPTRSRGRLRNYSENLKRYSNTTEIIKTAKIKTADGYREAKLHITPLNFYKLVTDKSLGILLNEKPNVSCVDDKVTSELNDIITDTSFWHVFQDTMRCYSSLGDGVLYVYKQGHGVGVNAVNPEFWYKVVDSININNTICHILVHNIYEESYDDITLEDRVIALHVLLHYKGYYIERVYAYDGIRISNPIDYKTSNGRVIPKEGVKVKTGLSDFAVFSVHNSKTIDNVYGLSEYSAFKHDVDLIEKKISQIDGATDKHFDPPLQLPKELFTENEQTGRVECDVLGNLIGVRSESKDIKYIQATLDIEPVKEILRFCMNNIATKSELGKVMLYGDYSNASGESLKTQIKCALDKVSRWIDSIEPTVKRIFCAMLELRGIKIKPSDISIEWQDGITESDLVMSQIISNRLSSGSISRKRALIKYDSLTEAQAEVELELIKKERSEFGNEQTT